MQSSTTDLAFDMTLPPEVPRLSKLPFIVIDVLCLATAAYVALTAPSPLGGGSLVAVVILVALGAIALAIPYIADYGQRTDAALSDRQQQIAALAQSTAASAEQISIAASSLHDIGESVARSAKAIEGLPQKLHDKIVEFNTRLSEASSADTEELEQELQTLRSAESDRLVGAIDQIAATAKELSRVETQIHSNATRTADAIASLPRLAEQATAKSTDALVQALTSTRKEIESLFLQQRALLNGTALESTVSRATATFASNCKTLLDEISAQLDSLKRKIEDDIAKAAHTSGGHGQLPVAPPAHNQSRDVPAPSIRSSLHDAPRSSSTSEAATDSRETSADSQLPAGKIDVGTSLTDEESKESYPQTVRGSDQVDEEPAVSGSQTMPATLLASKVAPAAAAKVKEASSTASFDDDLEDEESASALTEDGSTRLLVTAYIGIGNKLFVRGNGAGLSWDKGVPLQFVSIGKWRWETDEAHLPIAARLYKNDQVECSSIGMFTLEPGRQREIVATF